jgi:tRNA pseudouridine55 synthase
LIDKSNNTEASGFLAVRKPSGITSFDAIRRLRRILGIRKLGHSGVLDRPASGVLVVGANKATRLFELFADFEKEYEADIWLGLSTSTDDLTGELIASSESSAISENQFVAALTRYGGTFAQVPPAFSLAKKAGREAYRYALAGETVEVESRQVTVHDSRILKFENNLNPRLLLEESGTAAGEGKLAKDLSGLPRLSRARIALTVSGGFYVRSLARDIGASLRCGGAMGRLVRTRVGPFGIEDARSLEGLEQQTEQGAAFMDLLSPLSTIATPETTLLLDATQCGLLRQGQVIRSHRAKLPKVLASRPSRLFGIAEDSGELVAVLALGAETAHGLVELRPDKVVG